MWNEVIHSFTFVEATKKLSRSSSNQNTEREFFWKWMTGDSWYFAVLQQQKKVDRVPWCPTAKNCQKRKVQKNSSEAILPTFEPLWHGWDGWHGWHGWHGWRATWLLILLCSSALSGLKSYQNTFSIFYATLDLKQSYWLFQVMGPFSTNQKTQILVAAFIMLKIF